MGETTADQKRAILMALHENKKIEAIKLYREATGASLATAKTFIEALQHSLATRQQPSAGPSAEESVARVIELLETGDKIAAIKAYRDATGTGLKEAKEAVEAMAEERGLTPQGKGCLGAGSILLAIVLGLLTQAIR